MLLMYPSVRKLILIYRHQGLFASLNSLYSKHRDKNVFVNCLAKYVESFVSCTIILLLSLL